jgi:hypothetical protein
MLAVPIGKAGQIRSTNKKFLRVFLFLLRFSYWRSRNRRANSISQHKENERIGEVRTPVSRASSIVIEIA